MFDNGERRLQLQQLADVGRWNVVQAATLLLQLVARFDRVLSCRR